MHSETCPRKQFLVARSCGVLILVFLEGKVFQPSIILSCYALHSFDALMIASEILSPRSAVPVAESTTGEHVASWTRLEVCAVIGNGHRKEAATRI